MSLPKFDTTVRDLDSQAAVRQVFNDFSRQVSREDLFEAAEWYVRERIPNSSVYTFSSVPNGLMGAVIGLTVMHAMESEQGGFALLLLSRLMDYYGFDSETVPPRLLVREAIALRVRYGAVMADLCRITQDGSKGSRADLLASKLANSVVAAAAELATPEDAYMLTDVQADEVLLR